MFRKRDNEGLSVLQQIAMARGGDTVQADTIKAPEAEPIKAPEPPPPKHPRPRQLNGRALAETASTMGRRKRRERKRQRERELLERKEQERRGEVDRGEQRVGGNSVGGGSGKEEEEAKLASVALVASVASVDTQLAERSQEIVERERNLDRERTTSNLLKRTKHERRGEEKEEEEDEEEEEEEEEEVVDNRKQGQRGGSDFAGGGCSDKAEHGLKCVKRQLDFDKEEEDKVEGALGQGTGQERQNARKRKKDEKREEEAINPNNSLVDGPGRLKGVGGLGSVCKNLNARKRKCASQGSLPPHGNTGSCRACLEKNKLQQRKGRQKQKALFCK